jgi:hypothetical protein
MPNIYEHPRFTTPADMDKADQQERLEAFAARQRRAESVRRSGMGPIWKLAGLAVLAFVAYQGIRLWPDLVRYQKIRNM